MPSNASIQHYFNPHSLPSKHSSPFTSNPISSILTPGESSNISAKSQSSSVTNTGLQRQWIPKAEYEETDIAALVPGPGRVMIGGRIVNFYDQKIEKKTSPQAARGCIKLIVKDDTGVIAIKLWYADRFAYITLRLGQLVTICTPHISNTTTANSSTSATAISNHAGVMASIFPERDNSCSFTMQDASDDGTLYRRPLDYDTRKSNATLSKLVTLKAFVEGAYERTGVRILVCVKSLGARKIVTAKGVPVEKQTVIIFDHTAEASLTLWNKECISATPWKPSSTVLLITSPVFRPTPKVAKDDVSCTNNPPVTGGTTNSNDKSPHKSQQQTPLWRTTRLPELRINANTLVDIDPDIRDAAWLRTYMTRLTRRASVNPAFPTGIFDVESALTAPNRILFRLADLDEWVRAAPTAAAPARDQTFVGFLSVVVLEVHLARLHQRGMLCSGECCGVPLYANAMTARCRRQCGREEEQEEVVLRLNPKILGTVMDETGSVGSGKMVLSEEAWGQLLGRGKEGIVGMGVRELKEVEATMLFLRVTLVVGVLGDGGNGDGEDDEGEGEEEEEEEEKENGEKECSVESGDLINMGSRKRHGWGNEARREGDDEGGMSRIVVLAVLN